MKDQILKIAKVKSEKEFYKKYPTEEAFMKAHGKAFKKAAMGAKMVNDQLHQLTDFGNPPEAQVGRYVSGKQDRPFTPLAFNELMTNTKAMNSGISVEEQKKKDSLKQIKAQDEPQGGNNFGDISGAIADLLPKESSSKTTDSPTFEELDLGLDPLRNGGYALKKGQSGLDTSGISQMLKKGFEQQGGLGNGLVDIFSKKKGTGQGMINASQNLFKGQGFKGGFKTLTDPGNLGTIGKAAGVGLLNAVPDILQGAGQIEKKHAEIAKADQYSKISNLTASSLESQPQIQNRRYVRPEDSLVQNDQLNSPKGNKTNYLSAQNGRSIGGNPTEVQNTYAPSNMYVSLGFEPLNDSNPKQYAHGGNIPTAEFGEYFADSGQASIGRGVGSAIGSVFGPLGSTVGGFLGGLAGNAFFGGVDDARKLQHFEDLGRTNEQRSAWAQGANKIHAQNAAVMKDGGYTDSEHAWVSNSWQPQVITKFGEHNVSDLLKSPHDADMLRAGGHLRSYTPPSEEAMYTGRPDMPKAQTGLLMAPLVGLGMAANRGMVDTLQNSDEANMIKQMVTSGMFKNGGNMAMGGELKTTWGGKAETMSHNPYLPGTGETVMFKGQSHDETDGKGRSGIGVKYGDGGMTDYAEDGSSESDADVEVERQEPGAEMIDPETGEKNLVVYGNMKIPDYGVKELGDKKAKGKKFKHYVADLSKKEAKHGKTIQKSTELLNDLNPNDPFEELSFNSAKAMIMGSNMKLKDIANKKKTAAMVQNAILDTAEEFGVESDGLAKGKIRAIKDPSIGRDGKKIKKGQDGLSLLAKLKGLSDTDLVDPAHPERMAALQAYSAYNSGSGTAPYLNAVDPTLNGFTPPTFGNNVSGKSPYAIDYSLFKGVPMSSTTPPALGAADAPWTGLSLPNFTRPSMTTVPYAPGFVDIIRRDRSKLPTIKSPTIDLGKAAQHLAGIEALRPASKKEKGKTDWETIGQTVATMYPFFRPTNQVPLDPSQLMGETYAMGSNQVQPVQAQTFQPMLDNPYDISLQDQINAIDSQSRAAIIAAGQDPAAQAYIMSQAADAKNKVLGEQFRANQANKAQVYQANRQALNQAQLQNLGILDQQFVRQETAKSKTKAETIAALNSISDKIAKNKLLNRQLGIYENLYGFRFDDKGRAYNVNAPAQWNMYGNGKTSGSNYSNSMLPSNKRFTVDPITGEIVGIRTLDKDELTGGTSAIGAAAGLGLLDDGTKKNGGKVKKSANGSIVKALKNL
jgi:hypothetical protein